MADKTPKPNLALIFTSAVHARRYDFEPAREWRATVHIVQLEGRQISSCYGLTVGRYRLEGLVFRAYAPEGQPARELRAEYLDRSSDQVAVLKAMAKTLESIQEATRKLELRFGYATSLGAEVARVADALSIDRVMFEHSSQIGCSASQSIGDYESMYPGHAVARINHEVDVWLKPLSPTVVLYTDAPVAYDGMGTSTLDADTGQTTKRGAAVRIVQVAREHLEWQVSRYRSGMHYASEEAPTVGV